MNNYTLTKYVNLDLNFFQLGQLSIIKSLVSLIKIHASCALLILQPLNVKTRFNNYHVIPM